METGNAKNRVKHDTIFYEYFDIHHIHMIHLIRIADCDRNK